MKIKKNIFVVFMILLTSFILGACSNATNSKVSHDDVMAIIQKLYTDANISQKDEDKSTVNTVKGSYFGIDFSIVVEANSGYVNKISCEWNDKANWIKEINAVQFAKDMTDVNNVPHGRLMGDMMIVDFGDIVNLLSKDYLEKNSDKMSYDILIDAISSPQNIASWTYTIENVNEKTTIVAEYNSEK